jgi:hypothetical protein
MRRVQVGVGMLVLLAGSGCAESGGDDQGGSAAATIGPITATSPTIAPHTLV